MSPIEGWATKGLEAGLTCLVVVIMVQKFSLKAGIGSLLLMVIALGLYNSREDLANMFQDEVKNPSKGAPAVPGIRPARTRWCTVFTAGPPCGRCRTPAPQHPNAPSGP
ncbi:hypothetical protein ACIRU3_44615 [Streptomyces sp. NPDC101151]|uniref:hypothetical protein n=1 Tax=Streptomyces sp. NPDC101151 TaxID=3366115 RepID=UPI00381402AD